MISPSPPDLSTLDFAKGGGLLPAVVQDPTTRQVLMLGYLSPEALAETQRSGRVTFFSRSKNRLWTKGETSGNYLELVSLHPDCDGDTLLIYARPTGPVCHTGADTCFQEPNRAALPFLETLEALIQARKTAPSGSSYTQSLFEKGTHKIAQKVGEEAVELVIEALRPNDDAFLGEAADLVYHFLVLLADRGVTLADVVAVLAARHRPPMPPSTS
ncbi:MAG: bifunctional phosphoribosyl-AMP cyclohydrolase/phosphoribosyl-ATP diphosphatase HisIE [Bacteroidia bacterium]|nr:bifunctional phosphoribosyl-AMP cyclohydrolase/phosphoribosyl-ATP diphosphatase HisIE [Bacteroidia bacterium]